MSENVIAVTRTAADVPVADVQALARRLLNNRPMFADDMTDQQAAQLAMIALSLGLDPLAGELTLFEGKVLVTLDGRIRVCADHPEFDGIEYTRPATDDERKAFRVKPEEDMWVACVWRKGVRFPSVGYGRAGGPYERSVLVKGSQRTGFNPGRGPEMARKRALVNALRLLFPLPRPRIPGMEQEMESVPYTVENEVAESGQIIEGVSRPGSATTSAIHAAAKRVGYSDDGYRDRLEDMFGVRSSQDLNEAQAQAAIAAFKAEAETTAEERVAQRADDDPHGILAGIADLPPIEDGDPEPRFFRSAATASETPAAARPESADTTTPPRSYTERLLAGGASTEQRSYIERLMSDLQLEGSSEARWDALKHEHEQLRTLPAWDALTVRDVAPAVDVLVKVKKQRAAVAG